MSCLLQRIPFPSSVVNGRYRLSLPYIAEALYSLRIVQGIGTKMLARELQDLETNLLVKRSVMETRPVTVKYELTPHGLTLQRIINEMRIWGRAHRREVIGK